MLWFTNQLTLERRRCNQPLQRLNSYIEWLLLLIYYINHKSYQVTFHDALVINAYCIIQDS